MFCIVGSFMYCVLIFSISDFQILSELKAKEMTINEEVYAALISGHAESGDMQSATALLQVMKDNGLEPGLTSYTALLAG